MLRTLALTLLTALTAADMGVTVAQCLYSAQMPGQILEDLVSHAHETLRGREVGHNVWCDLGLHAGRVLCAWRWTSLAAS